MADERAGAASDGVRGEGAAIPGPGVQLTFVVVTVALVLLLVAPILVRQRSDTIREAATEVAEPARDLAQDIERDLAVQVAASRGFALYHDPALVLRYHAAKLNSEAAFRRLADPAARLGPDVAVSVIRLHASMARWQRSSAVENPTLPPTPARMALQQRFFDATIADAARVDAEIGRAVQSRRLDARRIDTIAGIITTVLLLLVLASVVLLSRLAQQLRNLAEESRRRARDEEALRRELEATMESRARLIRGFSHDVRNPLGAADGYAQLLENGVYGKLAPEQAASVARIRRSIQSAVVLTDDLLDLARLEAGQLQVERQTVDLAALAGETAEEYRAQAEAARLTMEVQRPGTPLRIVSDGRRIHQVLGNLISNAIKYTPESGHVAVRVVARTGPEEGGSQGEQRVAVAVSDTGIGVPPEQRARIFDEFARVRPEEGRGAGLGLTISRRLARALGGDITLEPNAGAGSTFTLWLPSDGGETTTPT